MLNTEVERIVWIDPNLKTNFGHPIEGVCSVKNSIDSQNDLEIEIVANREADEEVQRLLGSVHPIITNTCFQHLENGGATFHQDLEEVNDNLKLGQNDLVIVPTSYSNEIMGVKTFLGKHKNKQPKFAFQIHQFFPPTLTFKQTLENSYFLTNRKLLTEAFSNISRFNEIVSIWSTQTQKLNDLLNSMSPIKIGMLPLPIEFHDEFKKLKQHSSEGLTVSFLGDGRYEKGLLFFLEAVKKAPPNIGRIIIQDYNSRGYEANEYDRFREVRTQLEDDDRVEFINRAIDPVNFQKIIASSDVVVMPYNPLNYDKRVSEVYVIARMYNQMCLVSSGTWMASESRKFGTGSVFDYKLDNSKQTIVNLRKELELITAERLKTSRESDQQPSDYRRTNSPENVINQLIKHHE